MRGHVTWSSGSQATVRAAGALPVVRPERVLPLNRDANVRACRVWQDARSEALTVVDHAFEKAGHDVVVEILTICGRWTTGRQLLRCGEELIDDCKRAADRANIVRRYPVMELKGQGHEHATAR